MKRRAEALLLGLILLLAAPALAVAVTLTVTPGTAGPGDTVTWTVLDAPGRFVVVAYSQVPRGLRFAGLPVGLGTDAQILFQGVTDATGTFRVTFRVPAGIPDDVFYFQAGSASNAALTAGLALSGVAQVRLVLAPEQSALAQLNFHRARAAVPPVILDPALSVGAALHANYLVVNRTQPQVQGLGGHNEDPALPGYTPEGAASGARSNLSRGSHGAQEAVDNLIAVPYHRIPMLHPQLDRIGYGLASDTSGSTPFNAHVIDVLSRGGPFSSAPVRYPAAGETEVTLDFPGESPDPLPPGASPAAGYTVTLQFPSSSTSVRGVTASLRDGAGSVVAVYLSTPESPARTDFPQQNTIFMIPTTLLRPSTTYSASVAAVVDGATFTSQWSFTTIPQESPLDVPTLSATAFAADGITLDAPVLAEFFNEQVVTLSGSVGGVQLIGVGFRPLGASGSFVLQATAPVVGGRFRLDVLFRPEEIGSYQMLLFKSADGLSFQSSFSPAPTIQVF
jgi:uncharacterized protein YkwD